MSGYMVALESDGRRQIFMVREPDAEKACDLVRRIQGKCPVYTLAPISDDTLDYLRVQPNMTWHVHTHHCDEVVCCDEPDERPAQMVNQSQTDAGGPTWSA